MSTGKKPDRLFDLMGFVREVETGEQTRAVLEFRASMAMCHSGGIVQGGFVTGWIDAAMANAVIKASGRTLVPLSLEIKVSFLQSAGPGLVIAEGRIEKMGRKTAFLEGRLLNEAGEVLATGSSTARLVPMTPS